MAVLAIHIFDGTTTNYPRCDAFCRPRPSSSRFSPWSSIAVLHPSDDGFKVSHTVSYLLGQHREFGLYADYETNLGQVFFYRWWELPIFIFLGCLGGLLGALFIRLTTLLMIARNRLLGLGPKARLRRFLEVLAVALVISTIWVGSVFLYPCRVLPQTSPATAAHMTLAEAMQHPRIGADAVMARDFLQLWCADGEYNPLGSLMFGSMPSAMRKLIYSSSLDLLSGDEPYVFLFDPLAVGIYFLLVFFLGVLSNGLALPTGLFVPSLVGGSAFGQLAGQVVYGSLSQDSKRLLSLPVYTVIGASALLGGISRMTLSLSVMVMETTGAVGLMVPIMCTSRTPCRASF